MADEPPIPDAWRAVVVRILKDADTRAIMLTGEARASWAATFPDAWISDCYDAMARVLKADGIRGRQILDMRDPGEIWAFWFEFKKRKLYGKINLTPNGKLIIIYSAHVPRKGDQFL